MLDAQDLLEHADRCKTLANMTRMPEVAQRLRKLAQSYTDQARGAKQRPAADAEALLVAEQTSLAPET